jgi:hypothetical protein
MLLGLKLVGCIDWSLWWVLAPWLWIFPCVHMLLVTVIAILFCGVAGDDKIDWEKDFPSERYSTIQVSAIELLALLFVGLKLTNHVDWSWFWVLLPLLLSYIGTLATTYLIALAVRRNWGRRGDVAFYSAGMAGTGGTGTVAAVRSALKLGSLTAAASFIGMGHTAGNADQRKSISTHDGTSVGAAGKRMAPGMDVGKPDWSAQVNAKSENIPAGGLRCPKCSTHNSKDARFCENCADPL